MKTLKFVSLIACSLLWACQSNDIEPMPVDDATTVADVDGKEPVQVTEDVNSTEVENILDLIFDNKTKSRAEDYDIRILRTLLWSYLPPRNPLGWQYFCIRSPADIQ